MLETILRPGGSMEVNDDLQVIFPAFGMNVFIKFDI